MVSLSKDSNRSYGDRQRGGNEKENMKWSPTDEYEITESVNNFVEEVKMNIRGKVERKEVSWVYTLWIGSN